MALCASVELETYFFDAECALAVTLQISKGGDTWRVSCINVKKAVAVDYTGEIPSCICSLRLQSTGTDDVVRSMVLHHDGFCPWVVFRHQHSTCLQGDHESIGVAIKVLTRTQTSPHPNDDCLQIVAPL
jgi:hypothetical protein